MTTEFDEILGFVQDNPEPPAEISEDQLEAMLEKIAGHYKYDPEGFILAAFPFGQENTPLENSRGLEKWQKEICDRLRKHMLSGTTETFRHATASGHGIGKSAFVSMIIVYFMVCWPGVAGRATANTAQQLKSTTWREVAKWWELCIFKHWFEKTATQFYSKDNPETWRIDAVAWSAENTIAFQGVHGDPVVIIFDEASGIDDQVWEVVEGALNEKNAFWLVFGNPNRNSGMFYNCFKPDSDWLTMSVDSREVSWTKPSYGASILKNYGEDAYKIRVLGQFPDTDMSQFIPGHYVRGAYERGMFQWDEERINPHIPLVIGVDVSRMGKDETVILLRRGNHIVGIDRRRGLDLWETTHVVAAYLERHKPVAVNIDVVSVGAGVVDNLNGMGYRGKVFGVNGGWRPSQPDKFFNLRAETWARARDWIMSSGVLTESDPDVQRMIDQASAVLFGHNDKGQLKLERKEELIKREGWSPDIFDALALTFARRLNVASGSSLFNNNQPQVIY